MTNSLECPLSAYYTRRDYIRDNIAHWFMKAKTPLFGSYDIERFYLKFVFWLEPENTRWRHTGQFCFHCLEKRH